MIRIVLDTNVYVSALVFGGKPLAVLQLAESGGFQVVVSPATRIFWPSIHSGVWPY